MIRKSFNSKGNTSERKVSDKQTFFTQVEDGVSNYEEDDESIIEGRNEILFFAKEDTHVNDEKEGGAVDLEMELSAALDEIENLRRINDKLEKDHLEDRHELARQIRADTLKKDVEINSLQ